MLDMLVWTMGVLLVVTKVPDLLTTRRVIRRLGTVDVEHNRMARALFRTCGLDGGLVVVMLVVIATVAATLAGYAWSSGVTRTIYGLSVLVLGAFLCWVQLAAAHLNITGRLSWPLPLVLRWLPMVYGGPDRAWKSLISIERLPGTTRLSLALYDYSSPSDTLRADGVDGLPSGYYFEVLDHRQQPLGTLCGPYDDPAQARKWALARWKRTTPDHYLAAIDRAKDAMWTQLDRYVEDHDPIVDLYLRAVRYLQLRDLLALMELEGDSIPQLVADALEDVAYLKRVSTTDETPRMSRRSSSPDDAERDPLEDDEEDED
jgi:hypothetical protein